MGLLGILLTFPVSGPILTARAAITTIVDEAERRFYDEEEIRKQLGEVERAYRSSEISEEEFTTAEEALLQRLIDARRWRLEKAKGEPS